MAWSFDSFEREQPPSSRRSLSGAIGDYVLISELGHGGMATVFRARDERLQRDIALKVIHPHLRANEEVAERFTREARAVARLKHRNIVEVYDVSGPDADEKYLVVELVDGPTLRQLLKGLGKFPAEIAGCIGIELCEALAHAHGVGIVHRDVKPENVLVELPSKQCKPDDAAPRVKLTDFGIAKVLDAQGVTVTGQVLGSPAHMAPEQIEGRSVDERTDVYELGVLLYECIAGRLPFDGSSPAQVLRAVLDGDCPALDQIEPRAGAVWTRIIGQAMSRDRDARFASCDEFAAAINAELERLGYADSLAQFGAFLRAPQDYQKDYDERMPACLLERGGDAAARGGGDRVSSVSDLQRALAFRPDDAELMQQVHRAMRGGRRRWLVGLGAAALGAGVIAGAIWGFSARGDSPETGAEDRSAVVAGTVPGVVAGTPALDVSTPGVSASYIDATPTRTTPAEPPSRASLSAAALRAARPDADSLRSKIAPASGVGSPVQPAPSKDPRPAKKRPPPRPQKTRSVEVRISGATGGSVKVDGKPVDWQGSVLELSTGRHRFDFIPPTADCCLAPEPRTINIRPAESGEGPQQITGKIGFRPAVLRLAGFPTGASVECAGLLPAPVSPPQAIEIPMGTPKQRAYCTVSLPNGSPQVTKEVTLRAGQTTTLAL